MIVGGEIIAIKNKDSKTLVLYPRGKAFLTGLSGQITAIPARQSVTTTITAKDEIRRGEAIRIGHEWYRVSCAVGSGNTSEQTQRSTAPPSVTLDKDLSEKNNYYLRFTENEIPLDGDFVEKEVYTGIAYKHGCTNDVKEYWKHTLEEYKGFIGHDYALKEELYKHQLISNYMLTQHDQNMKKKVYKSTDKKRGLRKPKPSSMKTTGYGVNAHLHGTDIGRILQETREKSHQEALRKHQQQQQQRS